MIDNFAQIVGLLSAFSSGREAKKTLDVVEFQQWLFKHNHEDVIQRLDSDAKTAIFVKAYLNQQVPEIQSKLDQIIDLVKAMAYSVSGEGQDGEKTFSGKHFLRGMLLLGLERVIHSDLKLEDIEFALAYVLEGIGDDIQYNEYVLERMIRESLSRNSTATEILSRYWLELTNYS